MVVGLLSTTISIPESRSLKDKRSVLRSLKDRISNRMNVSVAEVGKHDSWKFADLAFATVAADRKTIDRRLSKLTSALSRNPRYVVTNVHTEIL